MLMPLHVHKVPNQISMLVDLTKTRIWRYEKIYYFINIVQTRYVDITISDNILEMTVGAFRKYLYDILRQQTAARLCVEFQVISSPI